MNDPDRHIAITPSSLRSAKKRAFANSSTAPDTPSPIFHPAPTSKEKTTENKTTQAQAALPAAESLPITGSYKLSALLGQANDATSAELASVLEHCNKISAILDPALTIFEKEHPTQGTALRQALAVDKIYAAIAAAEGSSPKKPPVAIPPNGQPHKRQVQRASRPSHQGAEDKRVMIRLAKAHPARDLDPHAIRERMRALVSDPTCLMRGTARQESLWQPLLQQRQLLYLDMQVSSKRLLELAALNGRSPGLPL
ncbi:hypothetical protein ACJ73_07196 [Blastomyces percursus]|uniref:Uncharacterized protein n=1 Tax=Blastomyces percursus TaxID=1658174 RepID=A0A1J9QZ24_9EURO|nr:hypothetical protein ACJ73_07196 [Blastomyces percursus]